MCLRAPLRLPPSPHFPFTAIPLPLVFISDLIALALFSHSEPSYLHISNGWSCHGVVRLPVTMTVNTGAQCLEAIRFVHVLFVFEYESKYPTSPSPLSPLSFSSSPSPPRLNPFSVGGGGLKQVCLSSVYSMCPLCPHAPPRVPLGLSPAECALCRRWELLMSLCTYLWNTCDSCHLPL